MIFEILTLILFLWIITFWAVFFLRRKNDYKRTLNLVFLRITLPKKNSDLDEKKETTKDFKEMVALMEQLLSSLKSIYSHKIIKKLLGQDLISFEYVAHNQEIYFYVVCPKNYQKLIEKQINGFYTDAIVEETREINIFEGRKYNSATYLYSKKPFYYPIKTYQKLESDPINNITNAFSKLEEDASAVVQILLKPIDDDWQNECAKASIKIMKGKNPYFTLNPFKLIMGFIGAMLSGGNNEKDPNSDSNTSALTQERAKTVDEKWDKTGYTAVIRVVTSWNDQNMTEVELKNILSSFSQFSYPDFNKFSSTLRHNKKKIIKNYIYRYFKSPFWIKKMLLNTEEIASIFHFPHIRYNNVAEIKWQNFKIVKAPTDIPKEWILIGHNAYRWSKKEIRVKTEDRFRHFYIIGQTGTGKTSTMHVLGRQDLANGEWMAVIDPHGDLVKDLLPFVPRERADDVIIFDPSDKERPIWMNILEAAPEGALTDIIRLFTDDDFQKDHVRNVKNPIVKAWWEKTFANMWDREKKEIIPYFSAKFGQFITNTTMRNIIGQTESSFDIGDIMQQKKILLVNLSKGLIGDLNSELLWLILVSKMQMAAMRRQNMAKEDRSDFYLYIDEFQNYITPSIESILSEARKYRLGLVLAHQYLGQLEKSDALTKSNLNLKNAIFGNVWSVMSYKVWPEDGEFMAKYYQPTFSEQDLINMDKFKAVMKLAVDNQPTTPFSIIPKNPYLETGDAKVAKALVELSRLKYGRDRAFVSKEIEYRIGTM